MLAYTELYRDVEFWQNGLSFRVIHRDFSFFINGAYGTFGRGTLFQKYSDLNFTPEHPEFNFSTEGFSADVSGYLGYAVNLTDARTYEVLFTPFIGYAGHFERLSRGDSHPRPYIVGGINMTSSCPKDFRLTWNGFQFGGDLAVDPGNRVHLRTGYAYNLLKMHLHTLYRYENGGQKTLNRIKAIQGGNPGQTGWAEIGYSLNQIWRIGLGGLINYFPAQVINTTMQREVDGVKTEIPTQLKLRWTSISGWLALSGEF